MAGEFSEPDYKRCIYLQRLICAFPPLRCKKSLCIFVFRFKLFKVDFMLKLIDCVINNSLSPGPGVRNHHTSSSSWRNMCVRVKCVGSARSCTLSCCGLWDNFVCGGSDSLTVFQWPNRSGYIREVTILHTLQLSMSQYWLSSAQGDHTEEIRKILHFSISFYSRY